MTKLITIIKKNSYEAIPLYYWGGFGNFGDELSPYLIEKITGLKVLHSSRNSAGKLTAIGSLLSNSILRSGSLVWGTGTKTTTAIKPIRWFPLNRKIKSFFDIPPDIRAVRGPVTRSLLIKNGYICPEIFGDPAILLPDYYRPERGTKHRIGLILHHTHSDIQIDLDACANEDAVIVPIRRYSPREIEQFVDEVCSCERIFSTSLHGVIVAQAYGIPAQWIRLDKKPIHQDEGMKFEDYFLGASQENQKPLVFSDLNGDAITKMARHQPPEIREFKEKKRLLDAFPYDVFMKK